METFLICFRAMSKRQAVNALVWLVLLPLTIAVWAQFLPPCTFGAAKTSKIPNEPSTLRWYMVCSIAGPCWEVQGYVD